MATTRQDKLTLVQSWLKEIFDSSSLSSQFDLNDHEILNELYLLAQSSRDREDKMAAVITEIEKQSLEYQNKTVQISSLLKSLSITYKDLPLSTQLCIDVLGETAHHLPVQETSPSNVSLGMAKLLSKEAQLKHELNQIKQRSRQTNVGLEKSIVDRDYFKKITEELILKARESSGAKERDKMKRFLDEKSGQYKKLIKQLQTELSDSGYSEDINHGQLEKFNKEIGCLEKQVNQLKEQLKHFTDLPPDLSLAKLKVEEAKQEMEILEQELSQKIDLVSAEI